MFKCRACLSTEKSLLQMDVSFVKSFNLLTGLNITMSKKNLYTCKTCSDAVKSFMEFRDRCIKADMTFQEMLVSITVEEIKHENVSLPVKKVSILPHSKQEMKSELNHQEICDGYEKTSETIHADVSANNKQVSKKKKVTDQTKYNVLKEKVKRKCKNEINANEKCIDSKYFCGLCNSKFGDRDELSKHLEYHKSMYDTQVSCGLCTERFANLPHMLGHRLEHLPEDQKICHICSKKFIASSATCLEFHYMRAHAMADKDAQIKCKQCSSSYATSRKLIRHVRDCHSPPRYECRLCRKGFRNRTLLNVHTRMKHTEGKRVKCELCDFSSKYANSLMLHTRRKHTSNTFSCKACYRVFLDESSLSRHVAVVCKQDARVVCSVCGHSVKKVFLKNHMRSHSDEYPFKCDKCPAQYKYRTGLKDHKDKHANNLIFHCDMCTKVFCIKSALQSHRKTHEGKKPFVCEICKAEFKRRYILKAHMNAHPWSNTGQEDENKT